MTSAADSPLIAAVDLGGTKILTLIVDQQLNVLAEDRRPSSPELGGDAIVRNIIASINAARAQTASKGRLRAVGIAAAGTIDAETGAADSVNLPNWRGLPIVAPIRDALGCPTILENDGTAAAWGEHVLGSGQGVKHMVYVTVGTGIGGGIVLNGQLFRGANGAAGELGHIPLDPTGPICGCGSAGCLEQYASGTAIARVGTALAENGKSEELARLLAQHGQITAEMVYTAARDGDVVAEATIRNAGVLLGRGLVALTNIFNPNRIVVGGGVSRMGDLLLGPARDEVAARAMRPAGDTVEIVQGTLGDRAGALGVAALITASL